MSDLRPDDDPHASLSAPARPELTGGRRIGVLVSHGFTGSPYSVRPWAQALADRGYGVEMPLLPGHGTTWQDLNRVGWSDWTATLGDHLDRLRSEHDAVVVAGLSLGGALVLRLAADRPDDIAGVVVVNPAVSTLRKDVLALPVLKHLVPSFPAIGDDVKREGVHEHAYTRTPLRAAHSMMRGWRDLRRDLGRISAPVLYFRSTVDHVVDDSSQALITRGVRGEVRLRMLDDSYHVATLDNQAEQIFAESAAFVAEVAG